MFYSVIVEYLSLQLYPPFSLASFFLAWTSCTWCWQSSAPATVFAVTLLFSTTSLSLQSSSYLNLRRVFLSMWGYGFLYTSTWEQKSNAHNCFNCKKRSNVNLCYANVTLCISTQCSLYVKISWMGAACILFRSVTSIMNRACRSIKPKK